jgi:hypothetical protein
VPGVLNSKIGHLSGNEIVEIEYDPAQTNLKELVNTLKSRSSFYSVIVKNKEQYEKAKAQIKAADIRIDSKQPHFVESKYSLRSEHPDLYYLDLTEQQAMALNNWSYFGGEMPDVLTDEQQQLRQKLKNKLRSKKPVGLFPQRSAKALKIYRAKLLQWLEK